MQGEAERALRGQGPVTLDAGESVRLSVHHAGEPIASDAQPTIFEPLTRGVAEAAQNIGLGLFSHEPSSWLMEARSA
jgi:hypothetical protein